MSTQTFSALTELGQARRLRPMAIEALRSYELDPTELRIISNGWTASSA